VTGVSRDLSAQMHGNCCRNGSRLDDNRFDGPHYRRNTNAMNSSKITSAMISRTVGLCRRAFPSFPKLKKIKDFLPLSISV
jgi:hypothetical protein